MLLEPKDPDSRVDYGIVWTHWLAGDTISTSSWSAPAGITVDSEGNTADVTQVWLTGGTAGVTYPLTNQIVTAGGRTEDHTIYIQCAEK